MRAFLYWLVRLTLRPFLAPWNPVAGQRLVAGIAGLATLAPRDVTRQVARFGGVPGLTLAPQWPRDDAALLYFHGGAYVIGGPGSHARFAAQLAAAARATTHLVDYRLAPEHPFPAAVDDALAAYRWLLAQNPGRIFVAGDSAGGGLALALAQRIRDENLPAPEALVLISPWTDLTLAGDSHQTRAARDPMLRAAWLQASAAHYAGGRKLDEPLLSPAYANLAGMPRMLIQVGSEEILLSDAESLARRAQSAGVTARLHRYDGLWHVFQAHAGMLAAADQALAEIGAFTGAAHA